jgi:hypothetical protein
MITMLRCCKFKEKLRVGFLPKTIAKEFSIAKIITVQTKVKL